MEAEGKEHLGYQNDLGFFFVFNLKIAYISLPQLKFQILSLGWRKGHKYFLIHFQDILIPTIPPRPNHENY